MILGWSRPYGLFLRKMTPVAIAITTTAATAAAKISIPKGPDLVELVVVVVEELVVELVDDLLVDGFDPCPLDGGFEEPELF